jgi:CheY-like chemotaxis protein
MPKILLVEDNIDQLCIRQEMFELAGYEVAAAQSAAEALPQLPGCQVVLMDLRIPQLEDGMELIRAAAGSTRIIVLSGAGSAVALPVDEFLMKPCSSKRLLEAVTRLCSRSAAGG